MEPLLAPALAELTPLVVGPCLRAVSAFDGVVEEHLSRSDEVAAALDGTRAELSGSLDEAYAALAAGTAELSALFDVIAAAEGAVERVHAAARASSERCVACRAPAGSAARFSTLLLLPLRAAAPSTASPPLPARQQAET